MTFSRFENTDTNNNFHLLLLGWTSDQIKIFLSKVKDSFFFFFFLLVNSKFSLEFQIRIDYFILSGETINNDRATKTYVFLPSLTKRKFVIPVRIAGEWRRFRGRIALFLSLDERLFVKSCLFIREETVLMMKLEMLKRDKIEIFISCCKISEISRRYLLLRMIRLTNSPSR